MDEIQAAYDAAKQDYAEQIQASHILLTTEPDPAPVIQPPGMVATDAPSASEPIPEPVIPTVETEPAEPPEPEFETLALTIKKGDTMDGLFRRNNLNLGHLAAIAELEEARQRFRQAVPGGRSHGRAGGAA